MPYLATTTYSERLALAIKRAGMTVSEVAIALGVTYQAISKKIDGANGTMNTPNNARVAKLLKVNAFWLATGEGPMEEEPATWPFPHISRDDFLQLRGSEKEEIERLVETLLLNFLTRRNEKVSIVPSAPMQISHSYTSWPVPTMHYTRAKAQDDGTKQRDEANRPDAKKV
jgi:transcriptional regulator with XRE-family HTH domain